MGIPTWAGSAALGNLPLAALRRSERRGLRIELAKVHLRLSIACGLIRDPARRARRIGRELELDSQPPPDENHGFPGGWPLGVNGDDKLSIGAGRAGNP